jgi:hypothetical protein
MTQFIHFNALKNRTEGESLPQSGQKTAESEGIIPEQLATRMFTKLEGNRPK